MGQETGEIMPYSVDQLKQIGHMAAADRGRVRDGEQPKYNLEPFEPRAAVIDPATKEVIVAEDTTTLPEELAGPDYRGPVGEVLRVPNGNGEAPKEVVVWNKAYPVRGNGDSRPRPLNYRV